MGFLITLVNMLPNEARAEAFDRAKPRMARADDEISPEGEAFIQPVRGTLGLA